jgi:hypothetical protein
MPAHQLFAILGYDTTKNNSERLLFPVVNFHLFLVFKGLDLGPILTKCSATVSTKEISWGRSQSTIFVTNLPGGKFFANEEYLSSDRHVVQ